MNYFALVLFTLVTLLTCTLKKKDWAALFYGDEKEQITNNAIICIITKEEIDEIKDLNNKTREDHFAEDMAALMLPFAILNHNKRLYHMMF